MPGGSFEKLADRRSMVLLAAAAVLWLLVACGAVTFGFFFIMTPTRWYLVDANRLIEWRNGLVLQYKFVAAKNGKATPLLSSTVSFTLIWQWCGTLAMALGAAGLLWLSSVRHSREQRTAHTHQHHRTKAPVAAHCSPTARRGFWHRVQSGARKAAIRIRQLLRLQVPPRGLWRWLLGPSGLTVLDLMLVLLWFGLHVLWLYETTMRALDIRRAPKASSKSSYAQKLDPLPHAVQSSLAKWTGFVGNFDLLLLFFPLPRCNFLHWLLGSDFPTLLKYHRWLGHGTLLMYSLHAILYMGIWAREGVLSASMQGWDMDGWVNIPAGMISMCGGWLIWLTSIPFIRRRLFNLFYVAHMVGTVVLLLFAFMHRKDIMPWVMPGILLYLLDVVLREIQQSFNSTRVSAAMADPDSPATASVSHNGSLLTLSIQCDKSLRWMGSDVIFLKVPSVSWWQWHPFTLASSSVTGPDNRMVLHIKTYNHWTKRLLTRLATDASPVKMYISGPYQSANRPWIGGFDRYIFVSGGIGATPAFGMLLELIARRKAAVAVGEADAATVASDAASEILASCASLIWMSHNEDELGTLPDEILMEANRASCEAWLDLHIYLTVPHDDDKRSAIKDQLALDCGRSLSVALRRGLCCGSGRAGTASAEENKAGAKESASRPLAHPYMASPLMWMVALVLCFGGAFAGLICAQAYDAHTARTVKVRDDYTHVGMLQFAALGLGAVLPPAVLMLAMHIYWEVKSRRAWASAAATRLPGGDCEVAPAVKGCPSPTAPPAPFPAGHERISSLYANPCASGGAALDMTAIGSGSLPIMVDVNANTAACGGHGDGGGGCGASCAYPALNPFLSHGRANLRALLQQVSAGCYCGATAGDCSSGDQQQRQQALRGGASAASSSTTCPTCPEELHVAVFVAGPVGLVEDVEEICAALNGVWGKRGKAYLQVKALTHEF